MRSTSYSFVSWADRSSCSCSTTASTCSRRVPRSSSSSLTSCPDLRVLATSREPLGVSAERPITRCRPCPFPTRTRARRTAPVGGRDAVPCPRARGSAAARRGRRDGFATRRESPGSRRAAARARARRGPRQGALARGDRGPPERPLPLPGLVAPAERGPPPDAQGSDGLELRAPRPRTSSSFWHGCPCLPAASRSTPRPRLPRGRRGARCECSQRLVDASLVVADEREGEMRYRLLETVREYAAERLAEVRRHATRCERTHAEWCLYLVEEAEPAADGRKADRLVRRPRAGARQRPCSPVISGRGARARAAPAPDGRPHALLVRPRIPRRRDAAGSSLHARKRARQTLASAGARSPLGRRLRCSRVTMR